MMTEVESRKLYSAWPDTVLWNRGLYYLRQMLNWCYINSSDHFVLNMLTLFLLDYYTYKYQSCFNNTLKYVMLHIFARTGSICYRFWQMQEEVADDKTAEMGLTAFRCKIFNFRFLAYIIK